MYVHSLEDCADQSKYKSYFLMWRCNRLTGSLLALIIAGTRSRPVADQTMEIANLRVALADLVKRVADLDSSSKKTTGSTLCSLAQQWCSCRERPRFPDVLNVLKYGIHLNCT
jgi:hypothetical protein